MQRIRRSRGRASKSRAAQEAASVHRTRPNEALPHPYVVRSSDLKDGTLLLMPENCSVNLEEGHNAPEELQQHMSGQVCAVKTNGDGACAMHSIFGKSAVCSELFLRDARAAAIDALRTLPGLAEEDNCGDFLGASAHDPLGRLRSALHRGKAIARGRCFLDDFATPRAGAGARSSRISRSKTRAGKA